MGRDLLANPGMKGRSTAPARVFCTDTARMAWPWGDDPTVTMWEFLHGDRWTMLGKAPRGRRDVMVPLLRTGKRPPGRGDGRRRRSRKPGQPFEPKYPQIAADVDRRRKAGEGFDRLARELKVSRGTILHAFDYANREEAAAAAREGRKPARPPYKWCEESRTAKRRAKDA